uniref:Large ribosomal subunit protein uL22c n=1 Tax=Gronococcus sybilensis TaxID=3028029 RepID=A0A9Y1I2Q3_9RHOD|nr:ribosomal protein L22 [Gronococcus sybilensis]
MNKREEKIDVAKATARYIRISPTKVRRILNLIRGKDLNTALMLLEFMPHRPCKVILNLLHSAVCNAENNFGVSRGDLFISKNYVNQGPVLKRVRPRAQGRACAIKKPTCHITIELGSYS